MVDRLEGVKNMPYFIVSKIGLPATLEQLAEESAELSKAALKLARVIRGENPTPVTYPQALDNLKEETADVRNCLKVLEDAFILDTEQAEGEKMNRWLDRLEAAGKE